MKTKNVPIDSISQDPNNARKHGEKNLNAIKGSLRKFGQQKPIVVDKDGIILAGNGTWLAASELGWKKIAVVETTLDGWQATAYALADNRTSELAEWDTQQLDMQLLSLEEIPDFDLDEIGWDSDELDEMLGDDRELSDDEKAERDAKADEVPDIPEDENPYGVVPGEIWLLGEHRLMCGDSTKAKDVELLMDGQKADMVFTDPPYNIASDSKNYAADKSKSMKDLAESEWDKNFVIEPALDKMVQSLSDHGTMYIWTSHFLINDIWEYLRDFGYVNYLVWSKPNPMPSLSKRHPAWSTELCVYASRGGQRAVNYPKEGHFLSCREVVKKSDGTHPTQKPLELITPILEFSSNPNQTILDLFLGSGSTLIACEKTGRRCYGSEIDPHYCSVIIKRWEEYTGQEAKRLFDAD